MDRQPRLSAVAVVAVEAVAAAAVVAAVAVEAVAAAAVEVAEERQTAAVRMREMSLLMEVSYLNRSKR